MICCDKCEDWFHGSCVGVTRAMGRELENKGLEWICPHCVRAEYAASVGAQSDEVIPVEVTLFNSDSLFYHPVLIYINSFNFRATKLLIQSCRQKREAAKIQLLY